MALNYGIIGNCKTAALVKEDLSIDWCCFPNFDSPSVFAKILDEKKGGFFQIEPIGEYKYKQKYLKSTNVLKTTLDDGKNSFEVLDYFPLYEGESGQLKQVNALHRIVRVMKGTPKIRVKYEPKLDYARGETSMSCGENKIIAKKGEDEFYCFSNLTCEEITESREIVLDKNVFFVLSFNEELDFPDFEHIDLELNKTIGYWKNYVNSHSIPEFEGQDAIVRSVLVLKLLTFEETGAVIAAATTSIPEMIGSERTWDYRYCWLRDAGFTVDALTRICSFNEADKFLKFVMQACKHCSKHEDFHLHLMYSVNREVDIEEKFLEHLEGYKGSKPVRVGNAAFDQIQNDVVGEVLDLIHSYYVYYQYVDKISDEYWGFVVKMIEYSIEQWPKKDNGIWEMRTIKEHFVFSKMMSWVAVDRGIKLAEFFKKDAPLDRWKKVRDEIKAEIFEKGWNEKEKAFTMFYGSEYLDASVLLMHTFDFVQPDNEKFASTVKAIEKELSVDGLVFRYKMPDDFGVPENSFSIATFWLIDALYSIGEKEKAIKRYKDMLSYANHLQLYSEGIDINTKELTGNFPQAYTHIALINTAVLLANGHELRRPKCKIPNNKFEDV